MHYIGYYLIHTNQINDSFVDCGIKQSKGKKKPAISKQEFVFSRK